MSPKRRIGGKITEFIFDGGNGKWERREKRDKERERQIER